MRKIILRPALLLLLLGLPLRMLVAEDLPKPFNFARYQVMMDRSPFSVATAVAAPASAPNFAKDLYIANAARAKEGDLVTIASGTDKNFKRYFTTTTTVDGFSISNIEWSDKVGATKVTITKDGQSATLGFNEALLHQPGQPGQPGQNPPGAPGAPPPFQQSPDGKQQDLKSASTGQVPASTALAAPAQSQTKPMPVPMVPTQQQQSVPAQQQQQQQPRVRGVIPRNPPGKPQPGS